MENRNSYLRPGMTRGDTFRDEESDGTGSLSRQLSRGSYCRKITTNDTTVELAKVTSRTGTASPILTTLATMDEQFRSAPQDFMDMMRMGRQQQMRRVFREYSLISFGSLCLATWEFVLLNNTQALLDGGPALLFWSYIWCWVGGVFIAASISEMVSMAPTSGGQYHWVSEFAGRKYQRILSYLTGWMSILGWQCGNGATLLLVGLIVQSIIQLHDSSYASPPSHTVLLTVPIIVLVALFNVYGGRVMPVLQNLGMVLHILGLIVILIVLWVLAPHVPLERALLQFENHGNWPSIGLAMMVGQLNAAFGCSYSDAPVHMSEEVQDAGITVPTAIMRSMWINGVCGLLTVLTFAMCIPDAMAALDDRSGFSLIYVLGLSISNGAAAIIMGMLIVIVMVSAIAVSASTARSTFAFSRDRGMPFSAWIAKVNQGRMVPINAVFMTAMVSFLLTLLYLPSGFAFNSIVTLGQATQSTAYMISISCVLYRRIMSPEKLPKARWSMGRKRGAIVNVLAIGFCFNIFVWSMLPWSVPTNKHNYNATPELYVILIGLALVYYYFRARKTYVGPVVHAQAAPSWNMNQFETGQNLQFLSGIPENEVADKFGHS